MIGLVTEFVGDPPQVVAVLAHHRDREHDDVGGECDLQRGGDLAQCSRVDDDDFGVVRREIEEFTSVVATQCLPLISLREGLTR